MAQLSVAAAHNITHAPHVSGYSRYLPTLTQALKLIAAALLAVTSSLVRLIALGA